MGLLKKKYTRNILGDTTKFILLHEDGGKCVLRLEVKLNRFLRTLKNKLSEELYNFLFALGSTLEIFVWISKGL